MDSHDMVVIDTKREQQFSFSVDPINNTQDPPSSLGLRIHFLYVTKHRIFVSPSSSHETSSSLIHRQDELAKKLSGDFDPILLLSQIDIRSLGDLLAPLLSQFKIKHGGEDHMRIASEVKRVGRRVVHERFMEKDLELLSLRVTITRVCSTYHRCEKKNNAKDKFVKENNRRSCPLCRFEMPGFWQRPITDMYHFGYVLA